MCLLALMTVVAAPAPALSAPIQYRSEENDFSSEFRFRMQNQAQYESLSPDITNTGTVTAQIRRFRLRARGHVVDPRLKYEFQLSFTRGDQDYDNTQLASVLRDALISYELSPDWIIGFGLTKLPGNRQRVVSSGDQQLVDRGIVNRTFNVDRDNGFFIRKNGTLALFADEAPYFVRLALTSGEGRGINSSNSGVAATGRFEWDLLGAFKDNGAYFESDLAFEPDPRVSWGIGASYNDLATRTGGQIGPEITTGESMVSSYTDLLLKWRGLSVYLEAMKRETANPIVREKLSQRSTVVYAGYGLTAQAGYIFSPNWEVTGRWATIQPTESIKTLTDATTHTTLGLNRFIKGHRVKLQTDLTRVRSQRDSASGPASVTESWIARFQFELGI